MAENILSLPNDSHRTPIERGLDVPRQREIRRVLHAGIGQNTVRSAIDDSGKDNVRVRVPFHC